MAGIARLVCRLGDAGGEDAGRHDRFVCCLVTGWEDSRGLSGLVGDVSGQDRENDTEPLQEIGRAHV